MTMTKPFKKCKVLLVTEMGKPYNNGWFYKTGLEKNGLEVIMFDPETPGVSAESIKSVIFQMKPDFLLHTKDELPAETFEQLRQHVKVVMWYPDPELPDWLVPYIKASDIFFTMSEGLVEEFRKYNPNIYWLSQAFEPSFFEMREITEADREIYSSDLAFVGNLGSKQRYLDRRAVLERILDEGFHLKWWGPRLPRKLATIPLIMGKIGRSYGGKFVWGQEYAKVARCAKIFLAIDSMPHIRKSMSARMYTAVGCGAFYLCRHVDGIEDVLLPDKEIVTFRDEDEVVDKIRYYLGQDELRKKIANAGRERVLRDHTYEVRTRQMMEMIQQFMNA